MTKKQPSPPPLKFVLPDGVPGVEDAVLQAGMAQLNQAIASGAVSRVTSKLTDALIHGMARIFAFGRPHEEQAVIERWLHHERFHDHYTKVELAEIERKTDEIDRQQDAAAKSTKRTARKTKSKPAASPKTAPPAKMKAK